MWMMGYNDGTDFNMADSFNGRKLRPIIPRVPGVTCTNSTTATTNPPCLSRINQGSDFFAQYHHLASVADQNKKEFNTTPQVVVSSRWNPTPEQLRALEDLYRRGTRTPNADQIQHITSQLRRYGKIEGKNVFYWFQNHKARERQKRRRQMESAALVPDHELDMSEKKELGASRTVFEVEHNKNWAPSTNCSTLTEESVSIQRATKAGVTECRTDGWIQFGEGELQQQQRRNFVQRNATWQMMQLSCPSPPTHHLINTTLTPTTTTSTTMTTPTRTALRTMDQKLIKTQDLSIFIAPPYRYENGVYNHVNNHVFGHEEEDCCGDEYQSQTLQLFPLRSCNESEILGEKETDQISLSAMNGSFSATTPCLQFFEFLPLKN